MERVVSTGLQCVHAEQLSFRTISRSKCPIIYASASHSWGTIRVSLSLSLSLPLSLCSETRNCIMSEASGRDEEANAHTPPHRVSSVQNDNTGTITTLHSALYHDLLLTAGHSPGASLTLCTDQ